MSVKKVEVKRTFVAGSNTLRCRIGVCIRDFALLLNCLIAMVASEQSLLLLLLLEHLIKLLSIRLFVLHFLRTLIVIQQLVSFLIEVKISLMLNLLIFNSWGRMRHESLTASGRHGRCLGGAQRFR